MGSEIALCGRDVVCCDANGLPDVEACACTCHQSIVVTRTGRSHDLKTWPEPFELTWRGYKHHEVRVDDRDYHVGDELLLREYDPSSLVYSGRSVRVLVTCITRAPFVPAGLCVMSVELLARALKIAVLQVKL